MGRIRYFFKILIVSRGKIRTLKTDCRESFETWKRHEKYNLLNLANINLFEIVCKKYRKTIRSSQTNIIYTEKIVDHMENRLWEWKWTVK